MALFSEEKKINVCSLIFLDLSSYHGGADTASTTTTRVEGTSPQPHHRQCWSRGSLSLMLVVFQGGGGPRLGRRVNVSLLLLLSLVSTTSAPVNAVEKAGEEEEAL